MAKQRIVGLLLLAVGSLGIGLASGRWFYRLYVDSIPEALKATTTLSGTRVVFMWNGFLLGLIIAVFALIAIVSARFFRPRGEDLSRTSHDPF